MDRISRALDRGVARMASLEPTDYTDKDNNVYRGFSSFAPEVSRNMQAAMLTTDMDRTVHFPSSNLRGRVFTDREVLTCNGAYFVIVAITAMKSS